MYIDKFGPTGQNLYEFDFEPDYLSEPKIGFRSDTDY